MSKKFAVKSNYFSLYEAFKKEVEKMGWRYKPEFNVFEEWRMRVNDCIFFHKEWSSKIDDLHRFAMSNCSDGKIFHLETEWQEAIDYAKNIIEEPGKDQTFDVTLTDLVSEYAKTKGISKEKVNIKY